MRIFRTLVIGAMVVGAASCASDEGVVGPAPVTSVVVTPARDTLDALGRTIQLSAVARDAAGNTLTGRVVTWSSTAPAVATVASTGVVTAVANGSTTIRATVEGASGDAQLVVAQSVAGVTITPGTAGLTSLGAMQQFAAVARDGMNNVITAARFLWLSSDPAVATIDTLGRATARRSGTTTITAAAEGIPGYAGLTVTQNASQLGYRVQPPPTTVAGEAFAVAIQVEVRDAGGALVPDAQAPVTLAASSGALRGTTTVHAINGVASFSGQWMELTGTGITITATSPAMQQAVSTPFAITHAAAAAVAFVSPPGNDTAGSPLGIVARIRDRFGNTATSSTDVIRLRLTTAPAGGALFGDTAVAAVAGVATFGTTNVERAGTSYVLRAVAAGLDSVQAPFVIMHAAGDGVSLASVPIGVFVNANAGGPTVSVVDRFGNVAQSETHNVTISMGTVPWPPARLLGTATQTTINGAAAMTQWRIDRPGNYQMIVTVPQIDTLSFNLPAQFDAQSVAVGSQHACAWNGDLTLCWGANLAGQLGSAFPTALGDSAPVLVDGLPAGLQQVSAGDQHSCALRGGCWGLNTQGQLGSGMADNGGPTPRPIQGGITWTAISAGGFHTCGIAADSTAYCWGDNAFGQLGDDNAPNDRAAPAPVYGGRKFLAIDAGRDHTCGVAAGPVADSRVYCWGRGDLGQLGHGSFASSDTAVSVSLGLAVQVTAGGSHSCAVVTGIGNVYCWGADDVGQLGDGVVGPNRATPELVAGGVSAGAFLGRLAAGPTHTCVVALGFSGNVLCWGLNTSGEIGTGGGSGSATPVLARAGSFVAVGVGAGFTCASTDFGDVWCWGTNTSGQLGRGTRSPSGTAAQIVQ